MHFRYALIALISLFAACTSYGNERRFTYTYETSVLPPGVREVELWNTFRTGRNSFFRRLDQRVEYEVGVAPGIMTALYLNATTKAEDSNGEAAGGSLSTSQEFSVSNEWKFKLSDRAADMIGSGLYAEATVGVDEIALEGKLLLDKQLGGTLIALNLVGEVEWKSDLANGITETLTETTLEASAGVSQMLGKHFSIGIEGQSVNDLTHGTWNSSVLYAGAVASYTADTWWAALTVMPQIRELRADTRTGLELVDHEKVQTRLLVSFHL